MSIRSWRDDRHNATWRGLPFCVDQVVDQFGRRIQNNEYPGRDTPFVDDLGRKQERVTVTGYLIEPLPAAAAQGAPNVFQQAKLWKAALEQEGPGTFVHVIFGKMQMCIDGVATLTTDLRIGGKILISLPVVEAGALIEPNQSADTQAAVNSTALAANDALLASMTDTFDTANMPSWLAGGAAAKIAALTGTITSLENLVTAPLDLVQGFENQVEAVSADIAGLIATPSALAAQLLGLVSGLATIVEEPLQALDLYQNGLFSFGSDDLPVAGTLAAQLQEQANNTAINTLVRASALTSYAQAASRVPAQSTPGATAPNMGYDTSDAAMAVLAYFLAAFDDLVEDLDADSYAALSDVRAAMVTDLQTRAASLPSLVQWTPKITMPLLAIAWKIYGDATRADEIGQRNGILDPGFVRGGVALEVLSE